MRLSVPALSRAIKQAKGARSKEVQRLAAAARRDADRSWSRKTAAVLDVCVRNEPRAASTWDAVRLFAQLPPQRSDVLPLLPLLQRAAAPTPAAVRVVGDMACAQGLAAELAPAFLHTYLLEVASRDAFRAVHLWKALPAAARSVHTGLRLYLAANHAAKAEQLAAGAPQPLPPALVRGFIEHYARARDAAGVQRWVDAWQAPAPADVNWLHHVVGGDAALRGVRLPAPLDASTLFPARRAIGQRLQHLASAVNSILAASPALFDAAGVRSKWLDSIDEPGRATLEALALQIARARPAAGDWTRVLKLVGFDTGAAICEALGPALPPNAYAAVLARAASPQQVTRVVDLVAADPAALYTPAVLSALAQRSPAIFLELALPQDALEAALTPHQLSALWRAGPPDDVVAWLLPLTLRGVACVGLLRSACIALLQRERLRDAARLLREFVVARRLRLDARLLDSLARARRAQPLKLQKLPPPQSSGLSDAQANAAYADVLQQLDLRDAAARAREPHDCADA